VCGNIKILYNLDPPATDDEIRASALQYVRKISGLDRPSAGNQAAFTQAVDDIATASRLLLDSLVTRAPARKRELEAKRVHVEDVVSHGSGD
jgi:hypothetical protein